VGAAPTLRVDREHDDVPAPRPTTRAATRGGIPLALAAAGIATLGLNKVRLGAWTVSDLLFLLSAAAICFKLIAGSPRGLAPPAMRKTSPLILIATLVIVVAGSISSFQSFYPVSSMQMVVRIAWITLAWFWVMRTVTPNRRTLRTLLYGFRFTIVVSCLAAIAGYVGLVSLTPANNENREAAFLNHPNELGGLLAMALPFALMGVLHGRGRNAQSMLRRLVLIGLIVFSITTTGSMTAVLGSVVVGVTIVTLTAISGAKRPRRLRNPIAYAFAGLALAGGLVWIASSDLPVVNRFADIDDEGSEVSKSVGSRGNINGVILGNLDDYLIVGVGLDANTTNLVEGEQNASRVHNMYIKLIYEAGIPGLVGLCILVGTAVRQGWRLFLNTRSDRELYPLTVAMLASLAGISFFAFFQPLFVQRYYWLPVALINVVWALRRQELREAATVDPGVPTGVAGPPRR
jgi:O-antigen ligase